MVAALLVATLMLQPFLAEPGPLRLVAVGTGPDTVEWSLDGAVVATTRDGEAAHVNASAGEHSIVARTAHEGPWSALVRSEPAGPGIEYVPAWTAHWDAPVTSASRVPAQGLPLAPMGAGLLLAGAALAWRRMARAEP